MLIYDLETSKNSINGNLLECNLRANARRNQSPGEGRHKIARAWSRVSGGTPGKRNKQTGTPVEG